LYQQLYAESSMNRFLVYGFWFLFLVVSSLSNLCNLRHLRMRSPQIAHEVYARPIRR
jgi:hypothetical protein